MPTLNWIGKEKVVNHADAVPFHVLEQKYNFGGASENKIIHGDNLLALKSLLPEYERRVKCIYIDPPYNTGNEGWIYNDKVNSPQIKKWLGEVVGREGEDLSRHDKWLCMMYPRLKLLKKLLSNDGAIFISINFRDEYHNLRCICDEIFGTSNYVGTLTWESLTQPTNSGRAKFGLQIKTEAILCYRNNAAENIFKLSPVKTEKKYPHNGKFGKCRFEIIEKSDSGSFSRPTMKFKILEQYPREGKRWQIGEETARQLEERGRLEIVDGIVKKAVYPEDEIDNTKFAPFWSHLKAEDFGTAQTAKENLNSIMGKNIGFETVKPVELIEELIKHLDDDSIILDSFAGSGTTAHAVLKLNKEDGGNRKFILVEMENYADSITAERVRRVIQGYGEVEGTGGNFDFYEVGEPLMINDEINENIAVEKICAYVWYTETHTPYKKPSGNNSAYLGEFNGTGIYFHYEKGNLTTLDAQFLRSIEIQAENYLIYADECGLSEKQLEDFHITFKKIPRDIKKIWSNEI